MTASVGIAIYPDDGEDVDTLIARADAAMYDTKRQRAGGVAFHGRRRRIERRRAAAAGIRRSAECARDGVERRLADLREANEQLVLAALSAQELQAAAEQARQRQTAFMAAVADELRNPHGADPHRQRDAGPAGRRRAAAAARAGHRRTAA